MIIVRLTGGIGNQMFQYAAGCALAWRHSTELRFDLEWFDAFKLHQGLELPRVFGLELPIASTSDKRQVLGLLAETGVRRTFSWHSLRWLRTSRLAIEPHFHYWAGFHGLSAETYLDGYWQSELYFASIAERIRATFGFSLPLDDCSADLAREMGEVTSVSLHVRRGDFARDPQVNRVHGIDLSDYYRKAIEVIGQQVANPHYYVFSDEPEWVRGHLDFAAPWTVVSHNRGVDSYRDMQLMSRCKHHILANSTFSWWGAWLDLKSDKIVIAPKRWFANDIDVKDLFPGDWQVL